MANGKIDAMKLHIDRSGRIVVPKPLRQRLGIEAAQEVEFVEQPNGVLLRPVRHTPVLVKKNGVLVHQGAAEPGLDWERVVDDAREERVQQLLKSQ